MAELNLELERNRQPLTEFLLDREGCSDCVIGCTGGCAACDVTQVCTVCIQVVYGGSICIDCSVRDDCEGCKCHGCAGCPHDR